jgi:mono/diheme cytochrome c family protein
MSRRRYTVTALSIIAVLWLVLPSRASVQAPVASAVDSRAMRGEAWFYQRCSLCHMGRIVKDDTYQPMAPRLTGVLKNATPQRDAAVREKVQQGSLRMPGFRYNLTPAEFEELMAYLKTL